MEPQTANPTFPLETRAPSQGSAQAPSQGSSQGAFDDRERGREKVTPELVDLTRDILTEQVWDVISDVHRAFGRDIPPGVAELNLQPPPAPADTIRTGRWQVAAPAKGLTRRYTELCLPAGEESASSVLTSGADVWVADLEDSMSPTWENILAGQAAMARYARGYHEEHPTMVMRPRGLHLREPRIEVDGEAVSAAIVDVVIFFHHNARTLVDRGVGPYLYLPKLETPEQARWWNALLTHLEDGYALPRGSARAAVLVETLPGALAMEEILYELRHHAAGLTAGRWDFLFSMLKALRGEQFNLPDCSTITMTTPFMRALTEQLIDVAHRRGTHAIGSLCGYHGSGSSWENQRVFAKVRSEKSREAQHGFDGSWVAAPEVVPAAQHAFESELRGRHHQLSRPVHPLRDWEGLHREMTDFSTLGESATFEGLRENVSITLRYVAAWLEGNGNVEIDGVLEDASAAEISRAQVWQWIHTAKVLEEGMAVSHALVERVIAAEVEEREGPGSRIADAARIFTRGLGEPFEEFLMARAYEEYLR